jgi:hypothetical protein
MRVTTNNDWSLNMSGYLKFSGAVFFFKEKKCFLYLVTKVYQISEHCINSF